MRAKEFISEVKMNPKSLESMASSINAHAGMEFEMYVPGVGEIAEDSSASIKPRSINHICNIFEENPENDVDMLRTKLEDAYNIWFTDMANAEFEDSGYDDDSRDSFIEEYIVTHKHTPLNVREWLRDAGLGSMGEVAMEYEIDLPQTSNERLNDLADSFGDVINRPVKPSLFYHGVERDNESYIIEPDGSLKNAAEPEDTGIEFISPPLPLEEMIFDLENVIHWAHQYGCYTDESCGLHMNVSLDGMDMQNLDYVKLALFTGDDYILSNFGRLGNSYSIRALDSIERNVSRLKQSGDATVLLQQMQTNLESLAHKVIHSGITMHEMSLNVHDGYVEFRQPGGDWLNIDIKQLKNTLLRFVVALDIACDPSKHKQEYAKKLYQLLDPAQDSGSVKIFSQFSAGIISKNELINQLKVRKRGMLPDSGDVDKVWRVSIARSSPSYARHAASYAPQYADVHGKNEDEAINAAVKVLGDEYKSLPNNNFDVKLLVSK